MHAHTRTLSEEKKEKRKLLDQTEEIAGRPACTRPDEAYEGG